MARTSHPVKRADGTASAIFCQMDIDDGRMDGLMAQEGLYSEQVRAVLVKMDAESMAEGVAGDTLRPARRRSCAWICLERKKVSMGSSLPGGFGKRYSMGRPHWNQYWVRMSRAAFERMA